MSGTEVTNMITGIRKPISSTMLAVAAVVVLSVFTAAVAQADSGHGKVEFSALGAVDFVGFSLDPLTTAKSKFKTDKDGVITSVRIKTKNELVSGVLGAPSCEAGPGCDAVSGLLTGARLTSLHKSTAKLTVLPFTSAPFAIDPTKMLFGTVEGKLKSDLTVESFLTSAVLKGKAKLEIAGTAVYACFVGLDPTPVVLTSCMKGEPGQMFPIFLAVEDSGTFKIKKNKEAGIKSIKGDISVGALVIPGDAAIGLIDISDAKAKFIKEKKDKDD